MCFPRRSSAKAKTTIVNNYHEMVFKLLEGCLDKYAEVREQEMEKIIMGFKNILGSDNIYVLKILCEFMYFCIIDCNLN